MLFYTYMVQLSVNLTDFTHLLSNQLLHGYNCSSFAPNSYLCYVLQQTLCSFILVVLMFCVAFNRVVIILICVRSRFSRYSLSSNSKTLLIFKIASGGLFLIEKFHIILQERIVTPHMKHEYYAVCNVKLEKPEQKPATSKLSQLFHWLFSQRNDDTRSLEVDL